MLDTRFLGFMSIAFLMFLIYQAWVEDYGVPAQASAAKELDVEISEPQAQDIPSIKDVVPQQTQTAAKTEMTPAQTTISALGTTGVVDVKTDEFHLSIDLRGGNIVMAELQKYPLTLINTDDKVRLLDTKSQAFFIAQSGLQAGSGLAPDHYAQYSVANTSYEMGGNDTLVVPLIWEENGVRVEKRYSFTRGSHAIKLSYLVNNESGSVWEGRQYRQLQRTSNDSNSKAFIYTYTGGVIYNNTDKYQKIKFDDMDSKELKADFDKGWAAMIQHYFLAAWIPEATEINRYYTNVVTDSSNFKKYVLGLVSPTQQIADGESIEFTSTLFIGPKLQDELKLVAEGLDLTVDYGFLTVIAQPLYWLLDKIHNFLGNWGWSIIVLTILIKLVFYKLSEASYLSMAKMRKVTPKLTALRERYKDDRQKQSMAMMELYKKEKINPLGGCLPVLIQIPVFIALYWVLLESVEMRQAPFILWINDLSTKDPFYVLPVIMGITMYIQQKLNPAPTDPLQAKVFMMLPFIFTVFFAFFPSGLVLYWVANNTLTIIQQWFITKRIMDEK